MTVLAELADPIVEPVTSRREARELLVINLAGDQATMGRQHGELLREVGDYEAVLAYYPRMLEYVLGANVSPATFRMLTPVIDALLRRLEARRAPIYRARARAFCDALGLEHDYCRHMFVMDLLQNIVGVAGRFGIGTSRRLAARAAIQACSSLAVWGSASADGQVYHARNFDFPGSGIWEQQPAVVLCTPRDGQRYGFVTTRGGDVPGVTAFNEAGITISMHTCFHRSVRFSGRGAVDLGHELIRRTTCLDDAIRIARERPVASTWGILVSSARERSALSLEINGGGVAVIRPSAGEDFLAQTNRYRHPALRSAQVAPSAGSIMNSDGRFHTARRHGKRAMAGAGLDVAGLQAMLGSHEDPDLPLVERAAGGILAQGITVQSIVCDPGRQEIHVSVGTCPTGKGPYVAVPWRWSEPVGQRIVRLDAAAPPSSRYSSGTSGQAYRSYLDAVRVDGQGAPRAEVAHALERACELDPDDPTYRLMGGGHRLAGGDLRGALEHFARGLERERSPFSRGQLLLWASRAADAVGEAERAQAYRAELLGLRHPLLADYHARAHHEARRPYPRRRLRKVMVNLEITDLLD